MAADAASAAGRRGLEVAEAARFAGAEGEEDEDEVDDEDEDEDEDEEDICPAVR